MHVDKAKKIYISQNLHEMFLNLGLHTSNEREIFENNVHLTLF